MKKSIICSILLCALFTTCDQEPLFWDIAHEIPPIEPIITGSPSTIVADVSIPDKPILYVSNGTIWTWNTNVFPEPAWYLMFSQPGGKIKTLATAGSSLFSLDWNGNIKKWDGNGWTVLGGIIGIPEKIYGAGNYLFAGSKTGTPGSSSGYCILAMEASGSSMTSIKDGTGLLSGAAAKGSVYYLGTMGNGIYKTSSPASSLGTSPDIAGYIIGLINHGNIIVAVTNNSQIVYDDGSGFKPLAAYSQYFSGALASWENDNGDRILLVGLYRKNGSYGYGYRELIWGKGNSFATDPGLYIPGEPRVNYISSVKQDYQYTSGISNHVVVALYALPPSFVTKADNDDRPIMYASTLKDGFWAYRTRKGNAQWNGEDNSN